VAWHHEAWLPSWFTTTLIGSLLAGRPVGLPASGFWDGPMIHTFPHFRQINHVEANIQSLGGKGIGIISAWLRSPAEYQITFATESFVDELAAAAGVDPVQFRLRHLTDGRMIALLKAVAKAAGWQRRTSPKPDALRASVKIAVGRSVAISLRNGTYNAGVAEVAVNRATGKVRVTQFVIGQDNGLTINPRAVKLSMEAEVTQTVSRTLLLRRPLERAGCRDRARPLAARVRARHDVFGRVTSPCRAGEGRSDPRVGGWARHRTGHARRAAPDECGDATFA
jgi:nicotinate dehydrogenase subunit B